MENDKRKGVRSMTTSAKSTVFETTHNPRYPMAAGRLISQLSRQNWKRIVFAAYCLLLILMTAFHEPWYDEAQAWMIARSASLKDILFTIPHYEGHPPLWHLILFPFARLSFPFELTIKAVSVLIAGLAMWRLIFRSPFPLAFRLTLPFTYFFFYQYAVVSRPYGLLFLGFVLAAETYPRRNQKPFPFAGSLILLCLASSYGIVIAGGIALAWLYELWDGDSLSVFVKRLLRARRLQALLSLFITAVILILLILPAPDANGVNLEDVSKGLFYRFLYMFFVAPLDAMFYQSMGYGALVWQEIPTLTFVVGLILGIVVFLMLVLIGIRCKKLALLLVPYTLYAYFCAKVYLWTHHIGIVLLFLIFWLWCCIAEKGSTSGIFPGNRRIRFLYYILTVFSVAISLLWTVTACYADIRYNYGHGRVFQKFIRENDLEDYSMMISWEHTEDADTGKVTEVDLGNCTLGVDILPYFSHNLFYNFREGTDARNYSLDTKSGEDQSRQIIDCCREKGLPDIMVGDGYFKDIFPEGTYESEGYTPIACIDDNYIWKNKVYESYYYVYMKESLANTIGMSPVPFRESEETDD